MGNSARAFLTTAAIAITMAGHTMTASPAIAAPATIVAGTLTCSGKGGVGYILGSTESLICTFSSVSGGFSEPYTGTISKIGIDIGIKGPSILVWTVLSSGSSLPRGALEGSYGGVAADAAVGIGAGANALIGGSDNSLVLQPVSVKGQTGLNVAVGVAGLELRRGENY